MRRKSAKKANIHQMILAALLCAIGIIIPLFSPVKILLEPASFTLGSHIAIFIAMFISPVVAVSVALGTTLGFFWAGFPIVVVARAASHIIFAPIGALIIKRNKMDMDSFKSVFVFALFISIIHAVAEVLVVMPFFFSNSMTEVYYAKGFFTSVILLVGVGTVIHSLIDFAISLTVWKAVKKALPGKYR